MHYLQTATHVEKRKNPHALMPGVKSILVLGLSYPLNTADQLRDPGLGLISGYAAGIDYHARIPKMLTPLLAFLDAEFGVPVQAQVFTDSAPILERELGSRAGLGWIGKNSCLISPAVGSAFLLAEVFIDRDLKPDAPFTADRCGSCERCIHACPTHAILPDRTIDSSKCISYQTIENREEIPPGLRNQLGSWIFGCDVCQMVCPWNSPKQPIVPPGIQAVSLTLAQMAEVLKMSFSELRERFSTSAVSRAKGNGFKRNILLRMAQMPAAQPFLEEYNREINESSL